MATDLGMGSDSSSKSPSSGAKSFPGMVVNFGAELVCAYADGRREAKAWRERILYKRALMARR